MTATAAPLSINATAQNQKFVAYWLFGMAVLVAIMVVIGGVTRLTGSGLSMVEWRPLMGTLPPLNAAEWQRVFDLYRASPEYEQLNYGMDLGGFKTIFFWEYFHRLWGRLLGLAFGLPFIFLLVTRRVPVGYNRRLTTLLLLGGFQGVIGWWMVKSGLSEDATVSQYRLAVHLGTALVIFSLLVWTGLDLFYRPSRRPRGHTMGSLLLIAITILAGALVAGMDAGLLYNEYPLMGNGLLPIEYGDAGYLDAFENPASAQFHHRWIAALTFAAVIALGIRAWRGGHTILGGAVIGAVTVQFLLGIATLLHGVPVTLGGMHQAGAVILLGATLVLAHAQHRAANGGQAGS
ncbi:MAG: COX15/CtaA family protein [Alphaproteobacteria bacterium]|jgi:cytochrome c oxidase assembly protein subunit 15